MIRFKISAGSNMLDAEVYDDCRVFGDGFLFAYCNYEHAYDRDDPNGIPTPHRFYVEFSQISEQVWKDIFVDPDTVALEYGVDFVKCVYQTLTHNKTIDFNDKESYSFAEQYAEVEDWVPTIDLSIFEKFMGNGDEE